MGAGGQSDKEKNKKGEQDIQATIFKPPITPYVPGGGNGEDFPGYDNEFGEDDNQAQDEQNDGTHGKNSYDPDAIFYITNMSI